MTQKQILALAIAVSLAVGAASVGLYQILRPTSTQKQITGSAIDSLLMEYDPEDFPDPTSQIKGKIVSMTFVRGADTTERSCAANNPCEFRVTLSGRDIVIKDIEQNRKWFLEMQYPKIDETGPDKNTRKRRFWQFSRTAQIQKIIIKRTGENPPEESWDCSPTMYCSFVVSY